jgi:hypothetical protein
VSEAESHPDEFDEFKSAPIRLRSGNAFSMVLLMNHCLCGLSSNNYRHSIARQINIEHYDNNSKSPTSVVAQLRLPTQLNSINKDNAATQQDQPLRRETGFFSRTQVPASALVWRAAFRPLLGGLGG